MTISFSARWLSIPIATFAPLAASDHHGLLRTFFTAWRLNVYLVAAVMLGSIVLYLLQQVGDLAS
jgi:hypothetical protein